MADSKEFPVISSDEYNQAEGITTDVEQDHDNPDMRQQQPSMEAIIGSLELMASGTLIETNDTRFVDADPEIEAGMQSLIDGIDKIIIQMDAAIKDVEQNINHAVLEKLVENRDKIREWRATILERNTSDRWQKMTKEEKNFVLNGALKDIAVYLDNFKK